MERERRPLVTSLALQLEKIRLRRIIFAVLKVAQSDANQPIAQTTTATARGSGLESFETSTCANGPGPATPRSMGRLGAYTRQFSSTADTPPSFRPVGDRCLPPP